MAGYSAGSASVQIVPDFSGAQRMIGAWFAQQGDLRVNVQPDLDRSALTRIHQQIASNNATMKVDVDYKDFAAKTGRVLDKLTGFSQIDNIFRSIFGPRSVLMTGGVGALTALAAAASTVAPALLTIPAAAAAAGAGLGAVMVGITGVMDAFKSISAADDASASDAAAAGAKRQAAAAAVQSATKGVETAERGLEQAHRAVASAEQGLVDAHQGVADALYQLEQANQRVADAEYGVEQAELQLAHAQENTARAQEDLNIARREATQDLAAMNRELASSSLDEEAAVLAVERALERLNQTKAVGSKATELDKKSADLAYRQSLQSLDDVRARNAQLAQDVQEANAKGVEGSDKVVAAKERVATSMEAEASAAHGVAAAHQGVADAQHGVEQAQRGVADANRGVTTAEVALADAQRGVQDASQGVAEAQQQLAEALKDQASGAGAASAAQAKMAKALANLSPAARDFVLQMKALGPMWKDLRLDVQEKLFAGLGDTITNLARTSLPTLKDGLAGIAAELNGGFKASMNVFAEPKSVADFAVFLGNIRDMWHELSAAAAPFTRAFIDIMTVGSSFLPQFGAWIAKLAQGFADWTARARESGAMLDAITQAFSVLKTLGSIVGDLAKGIGGIFDAALPAGLRLLDTISGLTGFLADFLNTDVGQSALSTFFDQIAHTAEILSPAIQTLVQALVTGLLPAMSGLLEAVAPIAGTVLVQFADMINELAPLFYPTMAEAIAAVLGALAPLIPIFTELAVTLLPILSQVLMILAPVFAEVAEAIAAGLVVAVQTLAPMLPPIAAAIAAVFHAIAPLLPFLTTFAIYIGIVAAALFGMWKAWGLINTVIGMVQKAWALLNLVFALSPIGLIIVALIALAVGLVALYQHSETFRNIVTAVFHAVAEAGLWMWETILKPIWEAIKVGWDALVAGISWAWENILKPVFDVLKVVAEALGIFLLIVIFGPILVAWKLLVMGISWAWENILKPAWDQLQQGASWMWNNVLSPIFGWIGARWKELMDGVNWVWLNILKPVWDAIQKAADWMWTNVLSPIFGWIAQKWDEMSRGFGIIYDQFIKPIFDKFGEVVDWIKDKFDTAVGLIGDLWDGLKEKLSGPVQWVVDFVWNDGLRKLWNWISDLWGADPLPPFELGWADGGVIPASAVQGRSTRGGPQEFAEGGVLPGYTPGRDVHKFVSPTGGQLMLSGGEAVMRPEFTRLMGEHGINLLNAAARNGGAEAVARVLAARQQYGLGKQQQQFASGGIIDLPGWVDWTLGWMPGGGIITDVIDSINNGDFGKGKWGPGVIVDMVKKVGTGIWDFVKSWFDGGGDGGDAYKGQASPNGVGGLGPKAAAARQFVIDHWGLTNIGGYSNRNIAGTSVLSDHALGKAIDIMLGSNYNDPATRQLGQTIADYFRTNPSQFGTKYVIYYDRIANGGEGWTPYSHPGGGSSPTLNHEDHVHVSFFKKGGLIDTHLRNLPQPVAYDRGGYLPPGITTVYNGTGRPEPVLTAHEHDALMRLGVGSQRRGEGTRPMMGDVHIYAQEDRATEIMDELWHRMRVASRGGVYSSAASVFAAG